MAKNFKTSQEYRKDKDKRDECYVDGCCNNQIQNDYICEEHELIDDIYMHECLDCELRIPIFMENCIFHGGKAIYHKSMQERLDAAVTPTTFLSQLKDEAKESMARVAADTFVSTTRNQILSLLAKNGLDNKTTKKIVQFIDTDFGKTVYTVLLSGLMSALPEKVGPVNTIEMATQLRTKAMTEFGDAAMNLFFPAIMQVMAGLATPHEKIILEQPQMSAVEVVGAASGKASIVAAR